MCVLLALMFNHSETFPKLQKFKQIDRMLLTCFNRYKQLLDESRKDQEAVGLNHERQLVMMQQKLHERTDDAFSRFKSVSVDPSPLSLYLCLSVKSLCVISRLIKS